MTLELKSVRKQLGSFVLPELSLTVQAGEYFVLLGPSGVGKTVLLEIIAGLLSPDAGEIRWHGRDITTCPPERRGFAIVYPEIDWLLRAAFDDDRVKTRKFHLCREEASRLGVPDRVRQQ